MSLRRCPGFASVAMGFRVKGLRLYREYIGMMEKKMEATIWGLGFRGIIPPIMENHMEKKIANELESGIA